MFGANLAIPAQICEELSCGQAKVYGQTDGRTDRRRQRQYPFGLKGQRVKIVLFGSHMMDCKIMKHAHYLQVGERGPV